MSNNSTVQFQAEIYLCSCYTDRGHDKGTTARGACGLWRRLCTGKGPRKRDEDRKTIDSKGADAVLFSPQDGPYDIEPKALGRTPWTD